jgi:hypothetical protein
MTTVKVDEVVREAPLTPPRSAVALCTVIDVAAAVRPAVSVVCCEREE